MFALRYQELEAEREKSVGIFFGSLSSTGSRTDDRRCRTKPPSSVKCASAGMSRRTVPHIKPPGLPNPKTLRHSGGQVHERGKIAQGQQPLRRHTTSLGERGSRGAGSGVQDIWGASVSDDKESDDSHTVLQHVSCLTADRPSREEVARPRTSSHPYSHSPPAGQPVCPRRRGQPALGPPPLSPAHPHSTL